jgi:hypothetical protein
MGYPRKRPASAGAAPERKRGVGVRAGGLAKRDFRSMVRKELLRTSETKQRSSYVSTTTLKHNTFYSNPYTCTLYDGDTKENKSGEDVYLKALTVKMHFNTFADRPQVMFRILLIRTPKHKEFESPNNLFTPMSTTATNYYLAFPHTDSVTVLQEKFVQINGTSHWDATGTLVSKQMGTACVIKHDFKNQKVKYDGNAIKDFAIRLLVLAYDAHGTVSTDNLATMEHVHRLYFKDP